MPELEHVPWRSSDQRRDLAASLRALLDVVVRTGADDTTLADATRRVDELSVELAATAFTRTLEVGWDSYRSEFSLVGGRSHPVAPQLQMHEVDGEATGRIMLGPAFEGGPGLVHGGVIALIFDHAMAYAAARAHAQAVMTATITLTFRRPTSLGVELDVTTWVEHTEGRKVRVHGTISAGGQTTVEAEALFIVLTQENIESVYTTVV